MRANFSSKQSLKNIILNITASLVQLAITFYISPVIVHGVGASAYGFLGLANDFVGYAALLTAVFNSVASRFIAKEFYKENNDRANEYFNSLIVANVCVSAVIALVAIVLVPGLDRILTIPKELVKDVKITFVLVFASYIVTVLTNVFTICTFVTNRSDIQGMRQIVQQLIRFAIIIIALNFISMNLYWVSAASLIATCIIAIINIRLTRQLTPQLKIDKNNAHIKYVVELAKSGSWLALTSLSVILLRGLDLTVANILVGDYEMGLLSIARTLPNNATGVISTIAPIFTPVFLSFYAKDDIDNLMAKIKQSIRWMAILCFVPITTFIVYSFDFYSLWQSSLSEQEVITITTLSTLTILQAYFNSATATMAQISVVVNKLRTPVFVSIGCGIASIVIELLLLRYTDIGLYAIVVPTTIIMILRYIVFNSGYAAHCLKQPSTCFAKSVITSWACIPLLFALIIGIRVLFPATSWIRLVLGFGLSMIFGYVMMIAIFGRKELKNFLNSLKRTES